MKKHVRIILWLLLLLCMFYTISGTAADKPEMDPRVNHLTIAPNLLYISNNTIYYKIGVSGSDGTTRVGCRDIKVYKYTGTYWAWEDNLLSRSEDTESQTWKIEVYDSGSGSYKVTGTAYIMQNGIEYTIPVTSNTVTLY